MVNDLDVTRAPNLGSGRSLAAAVIFTLALVKLLFRLDFWSPLPDELSYALTAERLVAEGKLVDESVMFFPPLFVYLAACMQFLGVEQLLSVRVPAVIFGAGTMTVLYWLLATSYRERHAFVGTLALLLLCPMSQFSRTGQPETIHVFFGFSCFLCLSRWSGVRTRGWLILGGVALGLAMWGKEVALGYLLASGLYVALAWLLRAQRPKLSEAGAFLGCFLALVVPLLILGQSTGSTLLFEISSEKPFNVNLLSMGLVESLERSAANLMVMMGITFPIRYLVGAPLILMCGLSVIWAMAQRRSVGLLVGSYLIVMLPFLTWYRQKFVYYFLPMGILLLAVAVCEVQAALSKGQPADRPRPRAVRGFAMVGALLLLIIGGVNLNSHREVYFTRGDHEGFQLVMERFAPGDSIVASHIQIFDYLSKKGARDLTIHRLFVGSNYKLNWAALRDGKTKAVVTKDYYLETLSKRNERDWSEIRSLYPVRLEEHGLVILQRE